jgi:hypothetical protein
MHPIAFSVFLRNYNYNAQSAADSLLPTRTIFLSSTKVVNEFAVYTARYYSWFDFQKNMLPCLNRASVVIRTLPNANIRCCYHTSTRTTLVILTEKAEVCSMCDPLHTDRHLCAHLQPSWPEGLQQTLL